MKKIISIVIGLLVISTMSFAQGRGDRNRDRDDRDRNDRGRSYKDYAGALGPGDYCRNCALENKTDVPRGRSCKAENRYLLNNDRRSINARCQELGWEYGEALQTYSYQEWCNYCNAKTRTWDRGGWSFGPCTNGNVKVARCYGR